MREHLGFLETLLPPDTGSPGEPCTDLANAGRVFNLAANNLIWVENHGWYKWDGYAWQRDDLEALRIASKLGRKISIEARSCSDRAACEDAKSIRKTHESEAIERARWAKQSESKVRIESARDLAKPSLAVPVEELDKHTHLFAAANCTIDLQSFQAREPWRGDLMTMRSAVEYDPVAKCPVWEKTIGEVFAHDPNLVPYVQRVAGYCMTGSVKEQVMFIGHGGGANGKNTIIGSIQKVLGPLAIQGARNLLMRSNNDKHSTEVYDLRGKRMVVVSETAECRKLDESLVKSLTGDDYIRARQMRKDNEEFAPTHKILLLTNHKPVIEGADYAIWRRIHLIPFTQTFSKDNRDLDLPAKLERELPGILNWCIRGCREWQKHGLAPPDSVLEATRAYRSEMDVFQQFLNERCEVTRAAQVTGGAFLKAYNTWCENTGNERKSSNWIWERLQEQDVSKKRTSQGFIYSGVRLNGM